MLMEFPGSAGCVCGVCVAVRAARPGRVGVASANVVVLH